MNKYIVKSGDSLEHIAHQVYGDGSMFRDIADANNLDLFAPLPTGNSIDIPTRAELKEVASSALEAAGRVQTTETVSPSQLISWIF